MSSVLALACLIAGGLYAADDPFCGASLFQHLQLWLFASWPRLDLALLSQCVLGQPLTVEGRSLC